jgi:Protein of unknown function (DUF2961)
MTDRVWNPAVVDPTLDARAATFENPTGARGAGGTAHGGRKGAPNRRLAPGERVVLADIEGPGIVRHIWMTFPPARPERMRALFLEVFYDGADEPSVSVPCLDFFGLPHGRPVAFASALTAAQEGRGFNSYLPMPFDRRIRIELVNGAPRPTILYYQVDYTLQPELPDDLGRLHVTFRRENPTVQRQDFVIADDLRGPGRFLGCNVGVRVIDHAAWYGEGEVKIYRDGDRAHPTICGTGLEDYVCSAWGLSAHHALYAGAPLVVTGPSRPGPATGTLELAAFVSFFRWHVLDPVMFSDEMRVTIQQIGSDVFGADQQAERDRFAATREVTPAGWHEIGGASFALSERSDDYCATSFVYRLTPHAVRPLDVDAALADIGRLPGEGPLAAEGLLG